VTTLAALYGIERRWPSLVLALLTGFVTAVRPVGLALTAAFLWSVLTRRETTLRVKVVLVLLLTPLASCGLLAYMGYQWQAFGTPWGFALTQQHWRFLSPKDHSLLTKLASLAMLEPIWGVYQPGYPRYWENSITVEPLLFNLYFWNPILFILAGVLLVLGGWQRWLSGSECVLGAGLLGIPYLTRSYEMSMASHGRFAAVVVVNYLVIGRLLSGRPSWIMTLVYVVSALFLCLITCLYAANYLVF
jgi:hypothetical protein